MVVEFFLKPYVNGEVKGGNKLFDSEEVDNFEKLHDIAKDLSEEFEKMNISLHYHHKNDLVEITNEKEYQKFLNKCEQHKNGLKDVQLHIESSREKSLRDKNSKLCFEDIDELLLQKLEMPCVSPIVRNKINKNIEGVNGKFVIAYYAKLTKKEEDVVMFNGVRADVKRLEETAKLLGFSEESIIKLEDPTKDELEQFFNSYRDGDHSEEDCFIFAFSGHGNISLTAGVKNRWVGEYICLNGGTYLEVRNLVQKLNDCKKPPKGPKILLFDACRGGCSERSHEDEDKDDLSEETTTTNMENVIIAYATIPNKISMVGEHGSDFISCFCDVIKEYKEKNFLIEIHQLLTEVNNRVAKINTKFIDDPLKAKQTSCFRSSVCEDLYFVWNI